MFYILRLLLLCAIVMQHASIKASIEDYPVERVVKQIAEDGPAPCVSGGVNPDKKLLLQDRMILFFRDGALRVSQQSKVEQKRDAAKKAKDRQSVRRASQKLLSYETTRKKFCCNLVEQEAIKFDDIKDVVQSIQTSSRLVSAELDLMKVVIRKIEVDAKKKKLQEDDLIKAYNEKKKEKRREAFSRKQRFETEERCGMNHKVQATSEKVFTDEYSATPMESAGIGSDRDFALNQEEDGLMLAPLCSGRVPSERAVGIDQTINDQIQEMIRDFLKRGKARSLQQLSFVKSRASEKNEKGDSFKRSDKRTRRHFLLRVMLEQPVDPDNLNSVIHNMIVRMTLQEDEDCELRALIKILHEIKAEVKQKDWTIDGLLQHEAKRRKDRLESHRRRMMRRRSSRTIDQKQFSATDEGERDRAAIEDYEVECDVEHIVRETSKKISANEDPTTSMDDCADAHTAESMPVSWYVENASAPNESTQTPMESAGIESAWELDLLTQESEDFVLAPFLSSHVPLKEISDLELELESRGAISPNLPRPFLVLKKSDLSPLAHKK